MQRLVCLIHFAGIYICMSILELGTLCKELATVRHKWFELGEVLGVYRDKLEVFRKENYPLAALLDYCLRGNISGSLSWSRIASALESKDLNEGSLALSISEKYCHREESTEPSSKRIKVCKQNHN